MPANTSLPQETIFIPEGNGIFTWKLEEILKGDPLKLASEAQVMGFKWVALKVADGAYKFGYKDNGALTARACRALQDAGIDVWGWQYVRGKEPAKEAALALSLINELGLDGLFIDAEKEFLKGMQRPARIYAEALQKETLGRVGVGLCSYRFPDYFPGFPWVEFLSACNLHAPQIYWEQSHNPAQQLAKSQQQLYKLRQVPMVPIGSVYQVGAWKPSVKELNEFREAARASSCPGYGWWAWHTASLKREWWDAIKG